MTVNEFGNLGGIDVSVLKLIVRIKQFCEYIKNSELCSFTW